ncbi:MAG: amino acid adenylation domain-containing protein, partial [Acidimicrobiales bacterium]|nr:amino acid adenylation domain-containing protein [Acidimicrobiales bacterium]
LTYRHLIERADAVAHRIIEGGIEPGSFVGVIAPRSLDTIPAIVGVLRAGCAYVPIDPDYPAERIDTIVDDSGIELVLDPADIDPASSAPSPPAVDRSMSDRAYAVFTSGSTGRPKGVEVRHANIVYSTAIRSHVYGEDPDSFLLLSSLAFDSSMVGLWWTLMAGGTVVLPDSGYETDVDHMAELVDRHRITHLLAIPSLYAVLLSVVDPAKLRPLSTVIVAGEACPPNLVISHFAALAGTELHNEYGPTETTVWSHHHRFDPGFALDDPVPIGAPLPGSVSRVVDGELLIGGPGVTAGYVGQPDLTAERFADIDGARFYRTGDLVRILPTHELEFRGRSDQQVKVRGVRIELGEIENLALTEEAMLAAAADTVDTPQGRRLALWYSVRAGAQLTPAEVKAQLAQSLPPTMVPTFVMELAEMPLTPNGKIDRVALPEPEVSTAPVEATPLVTETQRLIAGVWAEVLGVPSVGPDDNYFDLGGDSILSIRIVSALRRHGIGVKPRDLFEHPTVVELEAIAGVEQSTAGRRPKFVGPAPLLPMQRWFFDQDFADPNHWNQSMWFKSSERLDVHTVERALATLIDHHDALRASFLRSELGWIQTISETVPLPRVQEFTGLAEYAVDAVATSVESALNIGEGRLVGAAIFHDDDSDRLFLTIHHLAVDGVSWGPLIDDLTAAYRGRELAPRSSSVAEFGRALSRLDPDPSWLALEAELPEPSTDRHPETAGTRFSISVDAGRIETIFDRMLVAIGRAHRDAFGDDRLTATLEGHGRSDEIGSDLDLSRTIGWFTAMYPIDVVAGEPVDTDPPLGGVGAMDQVSKLPRLVINYLGQTDRAIAGTDLFTPVTDVLAGYGPSNHRTHDLGIMAHVAGGRLHITWDYVAERHAPELIEQAARAFVGYIDTGSDQPAMDLVELSDLDLETLNELFG